MRLSTLHPIWLEREGERVGLSFDCPCCQKYRLLCLKEPTSFRDQVKLMHAALNTTPEDEYDWGSWVPVSSSCTWTLSNVNDFDSLSVHPSIDASASGNWHGWIRDGEIV